LRESKPVQRRTATSSRSSIRAHVTRFANNVRDDRYNESAATLARERTYAFFDEHLRTLRP
jgi:dienelactone hydrolase